VYIVGEDWSDDSEIKDFYQSGIDSLFAFRFAQSSGDIMQYMSTNQGAQLVKKLASYDKKMSEANPDYINAMFLSNHDQIRIANALQSKGTEAEKFGANVYMLVPGNSFTYYGEEIGMTAPNTDSDKYYRLPMVFDSDNLPGITVDGASTVEAPANGGVKQQLADKDSLLNFYRRIIKAKLQNPEIQRAKSIDPVDMSDDRVGAYTLENDGSTVMIVHNFDTEETKNLEIKSDKLSNPQIVADFITAKDAKAELKDGKLTLPPHSSVIIR
jgi:glycosidase